MVRLKLLITGISGLLGKALYYEFKNLYNVYGTYNTVKPEIENNKVFMINILKDGLEDLIDYLKPNIIIHTIALTDLEFCEKDKELSYKINVNETEKVVKLAKKYNIKFVYISTDYVFNGEKGNYKEEDKPDPINYYGFTKLKGEEISLDYNKSLVIRTTFYGFNPKGRKPGIEKILSMIKNDQKILASSQTFNSIISVNNLSKIILFLVDNDIYGIYHIGTDGKISRYEFLINLCNIFELNDKNIIKTSHNDYFKETIAKRPKDVSLNLEKLKSILNIKIPDILEDLKKFKEIKNDYIKFYGGNDEF